MEQTFRSPAAFPLADDPTAGAKMLPPRRDQLADPLPPSNIQNQDRGGPSNRSAQEAELNRMIQIRRTTKFRVR